MPEMTVEPDGLSNFTKQVAAGLDKDLADALEAELFGGASSDDESGVFDDESGVTKDADTQGVATKDAADKAVASPSPDLSETELFGPDIEAAKRDANPTSTTRPETETAPNGLGEDLPSNNAADTADAVYREAQRENEEGPYDPATSRYMKDENGNLLHKWKVEYAPRGGGGRAQCKDMDCLERHDQGGSRAIEKGCLRIGRRVMIDRDRDGTGQVAIMWHHARCLFNTFLRARRTTRIIESEQDIEGFYQIALDDQNMLRKIIDGSEGLRNVRFRSFGENGPTTKTPQKRDAFGEFESATKKRRAEKEARVISKGDRVWTFFRCVPKEGARLLPGGGASMKSEKPELAKVFEEETNGTIVVQFESEEHEKERIELYKSKKAAKIRGYLRYPRIFEGRKQRVTYSWIQVNRTPPKLCGCKRQEWGHACDCSGISCGRGGHKPMVWGVGSNAW
jgi:hypothetical protein